MYTCNTNFTYARAFFGCRKYPTVRPVPIIRGTPATKSKFPNRINVLLKKSVIPKIVKIAPDERKRMPSLRLEPVSADGSFGLDIPVVDDLRRLPPPPRSS